MNRYLEVSPKGYAEIQSAIGPKAKMTGVRWVRYRDGEGPIKQGIRIYYQDCDVPFTSLSSKAIFIASDEIPKLLEGLPADAVLNSVASIQVLHPNPSPILIRWGVLPENAVVHRLAWTANGKVEMTYAHGNQVAAKKQLDFAAVKNGAGLREDLQKLGPMVPIFVGFRIRFETKDPSFIIRPATV